jgi:hypothetical protein
MPDQAIPGREFLNSCPVKVRATMRGLVQVAAAPPKRFAGGGYWEAMKDDMTEWFEVLLRSSADRASHSRARLSDADYRRVRDLGREYLDRNPRSVT